MADFQDGLPKNANKTDQKDNETPTEVAAANSSQAKLLQQRKTIEKTTEHDIRILKEAAAKIVARAVVPVADLLKAPLSAKWTRVSFGCAALDRCTRGGVVTRGITEICGASGVGKSQLLLQLALTVQLPLSLGGLGRSVAFICTEDVFPSKRLFQMAKAFGERHPEQRINYLGNVYVEHVIESEDLLKCVEQRLRHLMASNNIGLIVIDSVAAIFRVFTNYIQRAREMRRLAASLLHYGDKYNCAVICVNQVATVSAKSTDVPCLGLAWAHLGRTRIKVSKVPRQVNIANKLLTIRRLEIMYSPETPNEFAEFLITASGVVDVPEN